MDEQQFEVEPTIAPAPRKRRPVLAIALAWGIAGLAAGGQARAAEQAVVLPPPAVDMRPAGLQRAVIAGGCFWGVQGVFQHVRGVTGAVSGYAGGAKESARYEAVGSGTTGHAEAVEITFDPRVISYGEILQIFMSVAHDPTQLNRQGPDTGPQYRSAIFPADAEQKRVAVAYIAQIDQARVFKKRIATTVERSKGFFAAEDDHQDYLERNPTRPYIVINDLPKLDQLKSVFPSAYRSSPVLVATGGR